MGAVLVQIGTSFLVSVLFFLNAVSNVWPSYTLKLLEGPDSPIGYNITKNDGNLIGSLSMLGSVASITLVTYVNETLGRKRTLLLSGLITTLGWCIIATAKSVTQMVTGRFLCGFGHGMHSIIQVVFISEITQNFLRGPSLSIVSFMYNIGALLSYIGGWFFSYNVLNYVVLTAVVVFDVCVLFLKETPSYLLKHGKEKEALASLKFYRGAKTSTREILDELVYLRSQHGETHDNNGLECGEKEKFQTEGKHVKESINTKEQSAWQYLRSSKPAQRSVIVASTFAFLAVFMGMMGVQAYAGQFFKRAAPGLSPDLCSVILALVITTSAGTAVLVTDMLPRRVLMMGTCIMSSASLALLGSMLRWSWGPEWGIPLLTVCYSFFYQLGVINVPFIQITECIPPQIKSFGSTCVMCCLFIGNFLVLLLFQPAVNVLGLDGLFFFFAAIGVVTTVVVYFCMRETRKVPPEIVYEMYERGYLYRTPKATL